MVDDEAEEARMPLVDGGRVEKWLPGALVLMSKLDNRDNKVDLDDYLSVRGMSICWEIKSATDPGLLLCVRLSALAP